MAAQQPVGPSFNADSAYAYCKAQCDFGPRTMNSEAHDKCGEWIIGKFRQYGLTVIPQNVTLTGFDGTPLKCTNIVASYRPELTTRILLCAHWDSRPWADNDPDSANWRKPVMGANDGASGVAVMLEIARLLASDTTKLNLGIDFVCFDAEDRGVPRWSTVPDNGDSWALGAQHWAANPHKPGYEARFRHPARHGRRSGLEVLSGRIVKAVCPGHCRQGLGCGRGSGLWQLFPVDRRRDGYRRPCACE